MFPRRWPNPPSATASKSLWFSASQVPSWPLHEPHAIKCACEDCERSQSARLGNAARERATDCFCSSSSQKIYSQQWWCWYRLALVVHLDEVLNFANGALNLTSDRGSFLQERVSEITDLPCGLLKDKLEGKDFMVPWGRALCVI